MSNNPILLLLIMRYGMEGPQKVVEFYYATGM
jgi:hypothetical protein